MRHARPAFSALSAQVWRATAYAAVFTLAAALLGLAMPLVAMHAVDAAERRASFNGLLLVGSFGVAAALLGAMLLAVRDRILLQAALWLEHTAGAAVLADRLDRGVMPDTLIADRAALDCVAHAVSGRALAAALDTVAAILPLVAMFALHPALGAVSLLAVAVSMAATLVRARASGAAHARANAARAAADKAWRTAAANGPMIAAHRMSAGIVADWEALNRATVVAGYGIAGPTRRMAALQRALHLSLWVLLGIVGVTLVQGDSLTLAGLAAAAGLHFLLTRPLLAVHDCMPDLVALEAAVQHLNRAPTAMADRAPPLASTVPADAGRMPTRSEPAAATMARPPVAYAGNRQRGEA